MRRSPAASPPEVRAPAVPACRALDLAAGWSAERWAPRRCPEQRTSRRWRRPAWRVRLQLAVGLARDGVPSSGLLGRGVPLGGFARGGGLPAGGLLRRRRRAGRWVWLRRRRSARRVCPRWRCAGRWVDRAEDQRIRSRRYCRVRNDLGGCRDRRGHYPGQSQLRRGVRHRTRRRVRRHLTWLRHSAGAGRSSGVGQCGRGTGRPAARARNGPGCGWCGRCDIGRGTRRARDPPARCACRHRTCRYRVCRPVAAAPSSGPRLPARLRLRLRGPRQPARSRPRLPGHPPRRLPRQLQRRLLRYLRRRPPRHSRRGVPRCPHHP